MNSTNRIMSLDMVDLDWDWARDPCPWQGCSHIGEYVPDCFKRACPAHASRLWPSTRGNRLLFETKRSIRPLLRRPVCHCPRHLCFDRTRGSPPTPPARRVRPSAQFLFARFIHVSSEEI